MSATFQRIAKGRLDWKLALDLDAVDAATQGDGLTGHDRYVRADEFVTIAHAVWREQGFDFDGRYFAVDSGGLSEPLNVHVFPRIFLSGTSPEALALGAKHADVHILEAKADGTLDDLIAHVEELSREVGRAPRLGLSLPIIAREDASEAWARVRRLLDERETGSAGDLEELKVSPGLWGGFDRLGFASSLGLVGSYDEVQSALESYLERGIEVFVFDGYPHVEEAYRLGQLLLSRFPAKSPAPATF
jgi:alkanesulfonate monooxygenase